MENTTEIKPLKISIPDRLRETLFTVADVFDQPDAELIARPMGLDMQTCRRAASVVRRLLDGGRSLQPAELKPLFHALEFARRELFSDLLAEMRELQKTMASIVTARTSAEIDKLAGELPKDAEQAAKRLNLHL